MNELPKVFVNPIDHKINNTQDIFRSDNKYPEYNLNKKVTIKDVDNILNSNRHVFRSHVKVLIGNSYKDITIISRQGNFLITIDNEKIPIDDIKSIEVI